VAIERSGGLREVEDIQGESSQWPVDVCYATVQEHRVCPKCQRILYSAPFLTRSHGASQTEEHAGESDLGAFGSVWFQIPNAHPIPYVLLLTGAHRNRVCFGCIQVFIQK
jgi:hypothetical protein